MTQRTDLIDMLFTAGVDFDYTGGDKVVVKNTCFRFSTNGELKEVYAVYDEE